MEVVKVIDCPIYLIRLAKIFRTRARLYLVGGGVRNSLLGYSVVSDYDVASKLAISEVIELLENSEFIVKIKSVKMGTCSIFYGKEEIEHTTFRRESYANDGSHEPIMVEKISEIVEDAKRRDFSINSLYYDILEKNIIDNVGGMADIKERQLRTVVEPQIVFNFDGIRLLRLVRLSAELNLKIEKNTYEVAKTKTKKLAGISGERKCSELQKILNCNNYLKGVSTSVIDAIRNLIDLGLMKYLNGGTTFGSDEIDKFRVIEEVDSSIGRMFLFFYISLLQSELAVAEFVEKVSNRNQMNWSKDYKKMFFDVSLFVEMFTSNVKTNKKFLIIKNLRYWKEILCVIEKLYANFLPELVNLKREIEVNKCPLNIQQLDINGSDLLNLSIDNTRNISSLLNLLWVKCINDPSLNKKSKLLEIAKIIWKVNK